MYEYQYQEDVCLGDEEEGDEEYGACAGEADENEDECDEEEEAGAATGEEEAEDYNENGAVKCGNDDELVIEYF